MNCFHKKTQTFCCSGTVDCFANDDLYVSCDIMSPAALAHVSKHIEGKQVGCDAHKWTAYYPPAVMLSRFLTKCRAMNTSVILFNYTINRQDINELIAANEDIIDIYGEHNFQLSSTISRSKSSLKPSTSNGTSSSK